MATQAITAVFGAGHVAEAIEPARPVVYAVTHEERERRARRGPTPEIFFARRIDNSRLKKELCPERAREMRQFAGAMALLLALVMFYGWQHFSSIEYGYRVEGEKQQLRQLEEQNRQLRLSEAKLSDPARIDRLARQMGMTAPGPGQVVRPDHPFAPGGDAPVIASLAPFRR